MGEGGGSWGEEGSPVGRAIEKAEAAERPGLRPTGRPFPPQPLGGLLHAAERGGDKDAPQSRCQPRMFAARRPGYPRKSSRS